MSPGKWERLKPSLRGSRAGDRCRLPELCNASPQRPAPSFESLSRHARRPENAARAPDDERSSPVLERRRALFDESAHAFLLVFGGEQRMEDAPLEAHAFGERRLVSAVHALL